MAQSLAVLQRSLGARALVYQDRLSATIASFVDLGDRSAAETFAAESGHAGVPDQFEVLVEDATSAAMLFDAEVTRLRAGPRRREPQLCLMVQEPSASDH